MSLREVVQIPHLPHILHRDMEIHAGGEQVRMPRRRPHLSKCPATSPRMADKSVETMMVSDRSRAQPPAGSPERGGGGRGDLAVHPKSLAGASKPTVPHP